MLLLQWWIDYTWWNLVCSRVIGKCWAWGGCREECAEEVAAILWSAGNGFGTASASATVTASSCAECLVGDGNLPTTLHTPSLACCALVGVILGRGMGCLHQGDFAWKYSVPPLSCDRKSLAVLAHQWIICLPLAFNSSRQVVGCRDNIWEEWPIRFRWCRH